MLFRTVLAVPASSERFLSRAATSPADALMVDLEDGVAAAAKEAGRSLIVELAGALTDARRPWWVRVNGVDTPHFDADVNCVQRVAEYAAGVILPKASRAAVEAAALRIDAPLVALVESARGVEEAATIAAHPSVAGLMFGALDYAADLAAAGGLSATQLDWAKGRLVNAAAASRRWVVAGPTPAIDNRELLVADARAERALGFAGKVVHPSRATRSRPGGLLA